MSGNQTDAMIARLEKEIEERSSFIEGVIGNAQDTERDLSENEKELTTEARRRIENCEQQLETLYEARNRTAHARKRASDVQREMSRMRNEVDNGPVEYRSAGAYALEAYKAHIGDREAAERLEVFYRAADHQKTPDNLGVIPDPVIGDVLNFIDAARPIVSVLGPRPLPGATWHRPKVTQHTTVGVQGASGAAADEKSELGSQKMTITRLTANAVTYGGYVNVSRQNIDFSSPQVMDLIVNDLAAQYSIETEAAVADAMLASGTPAVDILSTATAADVAEALWTAAGTIYAATRGLGRLVLAVSPSRLGQFGPLFAPVNPQDAQSSGFNAGQFGQGAMGAISGITLVMSGGLTGTEAVIFSTAAAEVYEQRVGTLQVTEPSVLGVQVAYAGYFTPMLVEAGAVIPISQSA